MQLDARIISSATYASPKSALEEALVNIWQKVKKRRPSVFCCCRSYFLMYVYAYLIVNVVVINSRLACYYH